MKKFIITTILIFVGTFVFARTDTTLIHKPVRFEYETITTKSGKSTVKYYAIIDGKYYDTTKTCVKRYYLTIKHGGKPNVAIVSNKKKTNRKIIVL